MISDRDSDIAVPSMIKSA